MTSTELERIYAESITTRTNTYVCLSEMRIQGEFNTRKLYRLSVRGAVTRCQVAALHPGCIHTSRVGSAGTVLHLHGGGYVGYRLARDQQSVVIGHSPGGGFCALPALRSAKGSITRTLKQFSQHEAKVSARRRGDLRQPMDRARFASPQRTVKGFMQPPTCKAYGTAIRMVLRGTRGSSGSSSWIGLQEKEPPSPGLR